ncbi:MAG TPA: pitrilysin family protein [Vicinamibacterales bacterium]|nr:pitrilysin family protein [Vicinamibacterales bacterium]
MLTSFRRAAVGVAAVLAAATVGAAGPPTQTQTQTPLPAPVAAPAERITRPPKLEYVTKTLANGLRVILHEDHSTPIVHLELWYHVGSKDERPGRTGFAHLFEHLMFKGSKNVEPDQHPSWITSIGGQANATTNEDTTIYWETVPSQYLPLVLWLEADRMASLRVNDAIFRNEREVVKEERRMRVDNPPFGRLSEIIYESIFTTHPYRYQTIGSMKDLAAASAEDVRDFYRTYYVPNNATLVLAGDFDPAEAMALVEKYLGRVPRGRDIPRDIPAEPAQLKERQVRVEESWPLPAVVVAHRVPADGHPDAYPMHIAAKILSDGQSSRIYRRLVYEDRIAMAAFGDAKIIEHPNLFTAVAVVQPGAPTEAASASLIAELERMRAEPVTAAELDRAKRQFARDYILGRQTVQQKAGVLAHAEVIHGDLGTADGEFELFMNVTAADVQRVARKYFAPETRNIITVMPRGSAGGGRP